MGNQVVIPFVWQWFFHASQMQLYGTSRTGHIHHHYASLKYNLLHISDTRIQRSTWFGHAPKYVLYQTKILSLRPNDEFLTCKLCKFNWHPYFQIYWIVWLLPHVLDNYQCSILLQDSQVNADLSICNIYLTLTCISWNPMAWRACFDQVIETLTVCAFLQYEEILTKQQNHLNLLFSDGCFPSNTVCLTPKLLLAIMSSHFNLAYSTQTTTNPSWFL